MRFTTILSATLLVALPALAQELTIGELLEGRRADTAGPGREVEARDQEDYQVETSGELPTPAVIDDDLELAPNSFDESDEPSFVESLPEVDEDGAEPRATMQPPNPLSQEE
ncbi:MAG: hypothetical protein R3310_08130 [Candidatus Competibacteraceae bacterium]|nr:hypothetical protein [Candidatus Competibacteraceae bacterium]